jgi:hypothetical protein
MPILMLAGDNDDTGDSDWEVPGWGYAGTTMFSSPAGTHPMEPSVGSAISVYYGGYLTMVRQGRTIQHQKQPLAFRRVCLVPFRERLAIQHTPPDTRGHGLQMGG